MKETDDTSKQFFELTPEKILSAVETIGLRCTGRCISMKSMENRVYEVEVEVENEDLPRTAVERSRVAKFYRPARWSRKQIEEEHQFLADLRAADIPVVAPITGPDGKTVYQMPDSEIYFSVFPKQGGRSPDELLPGFAQRIGRLLARVHAVGASRQATQRLRLTPTTYGRENLEALLRGGSIPKELENIFERTVGEICDAADPLFDYVKPQRIHGDCHFGNILLGGDGMFLVDFDDMVVGPPVQDMWLVIPGTDEEAKAQMRWLLEGYEEMREFDRSSLRLVEPLRALRLIHYAAWIAKRWSDPSFKQTFPQFESYGYWRELLDNLRDQLDVIQREAAGDYVWS